MNKNLTANMKEKNKEEIRALAGHPDAIPSICIDWFEKGYLVAFESQEPFPEDINKFIKEEAEKYVNETTTNSISNEHYKTIISDFKAGAKAMIAYKDKELEELKSKVNKLTMTGMTHNQTEAEKLWPKYEKQMLEPLQKQIDYLTARCEAAEKIIEISGIVDCEGYETWQELKSK